MSADTRIIQHAYATAEDIADRHVFDVLSLPLTALAKSVTLIHLDLPPAVRLYNFTSQQVAQHYRELTRYTVRASTVESTLPI